MTTRERFIAALTFGAVDRIPFEPGGPRESTLRAWHAQGLPDGAAWQTELARALALDPQAFLPRHYIGVDTLLRPQFDEHVLDHRDGHYVVQDWKGNICEIADTFDVSYLRHAKDFVTRRWLKCPVETRADWEAMRRRYDSADAGRIPATLAADAARAQHNGALTMLSVSGPFWQLREWCGFEGLCMLMIDDPELAGEMAAFWCEFVADMLQRTLAVTTFDCLAINEDMAYKAKAMISPAMTRAFCMPSWRRWSAIARAAGVPLIDMDSDGYVGELIPLWIESGINVCDPIEVAALNDLCAYRQETGQAIAYRMGVDKRAMAKGGAVMQAELDRLAPVVRAGGYVPGCDHGVPADVSWPAFVEYGRALARLTGWL